MTKTLFRQLGLGLAVIGLGSALTGCELLTPKSDTKVDPTLTPSFDNVFVDKSYTYGTWTDITGGKTPQFAIGDYSETLTVEGTTEGALKATVGAAAATKGWSAGTLAQVSDAAKAKGSYFDFTSVAAVKFKVRGTLPLENVKVKLEASDGGVPVADVPVSTYGISALSTTVWAQGSIDTTGFTNKKLKVAFAFVLGTTPGYLELKDIAFVDSTGANVNIAQKISYTNEIVTKTALASAIAAATTLADGTGVGSAVGQVSQADADTFRAAITTAAAVNTNASATQAEVDAAVTALSLATTAFNSAMVGAVAPTTSYVYKSAAGAVDLANSVVDWGSGTAIDVADATDATYNPVIKLTSGTGWGDVSAVAFSGMTAGKIKEFTTLEFKIKTSSYTSVKVKMPSASTEEPTFVLATKGTPLTGGWVQMSIPLSDFGTIPAGINEFGILQFGAGSLLLTDVGFSGTATVTPPATLTDPTTGAPAPSAGNLSTAFVVYSEAQAADATISTYTENWWGGMVQTEVTLGGNKALRYVGTGTPGESQAIVAAPVMNVGGKTRLHMDVYSAGVGLVKIKFVSNDGASADNQPASMMDFDVSQLQNSWQSVDVPLSSIAAAGGAPAAVSWSALEKIGLVLDAPMTGGATSRIYVDNLYFY